MGDKKSFVSVPVTTWVFSSVTFIEKWNPISNYTLFVTVSMFQVVRFPNDACDSDDNSKNGTCKLILYFIDFVHYWNRIHLLCSGYTKEECSERGGTESGTCASGFGVCCISELLIHYLFFEVISTTLKPFNYFHVICRHNSLWWYN